MGRILSIDYGKKRTGLAVTDPSKIIATPLHAVDTKDLYSFIEDYLKKENVETIVVGMPTNHHGEDTDMTFACRSLIKKLAEKYPDVEVKEWDESFTSRMAVQSMVSSGARKKKRSDKKNIDKVSATIILQSFMERSTF